MLLVNIIMSVIIIPGIGGPRNGMDPINSMPRWATDKLDKCVEMNTTIPIILLSAGTCYKNGQMDINNKSIHECTAMALYLQSKGIDMNRVYEEDTSYDTVGNAFFLRTIYTDINKWYNLNIIVNEFHYMRVKEIFEWIFMKNNSMYTFNYIVCPDNVLDKDILSVRIEKELDSLNKIRNTISNLKVDSFLDIHRWIFSEHRLYASKYKCNKIINKEEPINSMLYKSY